ncbi:hypothetical protein [Streptomyces sioyaensis]|uniref:hypothetical protein n=1 Tax=Streptomyces sioyaensis TaxID=67364 RepID=UPI003D7446ED
MPGAAPTPDAHELTRIQKQRELWYESRSAVPGVAAPPPSPYKSPPVEILTDRLTGYDKGDKSVVLEMTEGQIQALIEAGAIRLMEQRPSVAGMKEDNDG